LAAPGELGAAGTRGLRADPVGPVVVADEVAARPAQHAEAQFAEQAEHVLAEAALVRQRRVLRVQAAVDAPAQVLDEAAEHLRIDRAKRPGRGDGDLHSRAPSALATGLVTRGPLHRARLAGHRDPDAHRARPP